MNAWRRDASPTLARMLRIVPLPERERVGEALASRNLGQHLREANQSQTYNAPFGPKDRSRFLQAMDRVLRRI